MAKIVCIAEGTYREGLNNIGDIVSVHDDNVELSGPAYEGYKIIVVKGMTAKELQEELKSLIPEVRMAYKASTDTWSLSKPEEKLVWNDDGTWKDFAVRPKYFINFPIDEKVESDLSSDATIKTTIIESAAIINLKSIIENHIEVEDLNKAMEIRI